MSTDAKLTAGELQLQHAKQYLSSDDKIVLVAIDIEAYERSHRAITEVGIATLDTQDLINQSPGSNGEDWHQYIHARHFIIEEHKHFVNKDFVRGCPDKFEYGKSELVSIKDIASVLANCFRTASGENQKIVLVGHDVKNDIDYCHQLGFSILNRSSLIEVLDTAVMYKAITGEQQSRALGSIVYDFDLTAWHLHNAGNDAVYTLWAWLAMCVTNDSPAKAE